MLINSSFNRNIAQNLNVKNSDIYSKRILFGLENKNNWTKDLKPEELSVLKKWLAQNKISTDDGWYEVPTESGRIRDNVLTVAVEQNHENMVRLLLKTDLRNAKHGTETSRRISDDSVTGTSYENVTYGRSLPFDIAVSQGNHNIVKMFLDANANVNTAALHTAIENNDLEILKTLVASSKFPPHKAYIDGHVISPLELATRKNNIEAVKILLEGHNPFNEHDDAIQIAYRQKKYELMELLLTKADVRGILFTAFFKDDIEYAKIFSKYAKNEDKLEVLKYVVDKNKTNLIKILLDSGIALDKVIETKDFNSKRVTFSELIIHFATEKNNLDALKLLIEAGSPLDRPNTNGELVTHIAARNNNIEALKLLLENDAPINRPDVKGKLPLDYLDSEQQQAISQYIK